MNRLTVKDAQGNWALKGVRWEDLREGKVITKEMRERLYGALWKLIQYENIGLEPEEVVEVNSFDKTNTSRLLGKLADERERNRWIPVEEKWPPFGQRLQATILHHEWISDYDSAWVPKKEKVYHAAYTEVCEIYPVGAMWCYACKEDDYHSDIAYIKPAKDISVPMAEIIAWRPLSAPYRPERSSDDLD